MRQQTSAIERLRHLPALFRGADLTVRFQWTSKTASQYLYLWRKRGLVSPLGGHSDVFANLLVQPHPDWAQALRMAMPSATLVGIEALRLAGWTTQMPQRPAVAVQSAHPVFAVLPFDVVPRHAAWFDATQRAKQPQATGAMPTLRPAWALADLLHHEGWGRCGLQPDDIEWEAATPADQQDWTDACQAWRMPSTPWEGMAVNPRGHTPNKPGK